MRYDYLIAFCICNNARKLVPPGFVKGTIFSRAEEVNTPKVNTYAPKF
jgi:hypothetical protein